MIPELFALAVMGVVANLIGYFIDWDTALCFLLGAIYGSIRSYVIRTRSNHDHAA